MIPGEHAHPHGSTARGPRGALDAARLELLIGPERMARFEQIDDASQRPFAGRTVLNINSTATGGGVAEMLPTLLAYVRGADARVVATSGSASSPRPGSSPSSWCSR